jgi:peptidoglycan-associated lipoprotein
MLGATAGCVASGTSSEVALTGLTDPRGTEEYNLALGERRAQSVRDYLERLGVTSAKVRARSTGEENATGTDESSWSRDRRCQVEAR